MSDEKEDKNGIRSQSNGLGEVGVGIVDTEIEDGCNANIYKDTPKRIGDGILALAHDVTKNHGRGITCKACPSTGHVAITRNKQHVDGNEHHTTDA